MDKKTNKALEELAGVVEPPHAVGKWGSFLLAVLAMMFLAGASFYWGWNWGHDVGRKKANDTDAWIEGYDYRAAQERETTPDA